MENFVGNASLVRVVSLWDYLALLLLALFRIQAILVIYLRQLADIRWVVMLAGEDFLILLMGLAATAVALIILVALRL
jgi:hypothetical protein